MIYQSDREYLPFAKAAKLAGLEKSRAYELREKQKFPAVEEEIWNRKIYRVETLELMDFIERRIKKKEAQREKLKKEIDKLKANKQWCKELYHGR